MAVVIHLFGGIQPASGLKLFAAAIRCGRRYRDLFGVAVIQSFNVVGFGTIQSQAVGAFAIQEV